MAGKAIRVNTNLAHMPMVYQIRRRTGLETAAVVGALICLWIEADKESRDGSMQGDLTTIDIITNCVGFGHILAENGWATLEGDRVRLHQHNPRVASKKGRLWKGIPRHNRRGIPAEIREQVAPPGVACVACGSTERIEVDHIVPVSRGGSDDIENLQPLCLKCNRSKSAKTMDEFMARRASA